MAIKLIKKFVPIYAISLITRFSNCSYSLETISFKTFLTEQFEKQKKKHLGKKRSSKKTKFKIICFTI